MKHLTATIVCLLCLLTVTTNAQDAELDPTPPQFKVTIDGYVMSGVPVSKIVIKAYDIDGNFDSTYNGEPLITGIRLETRTSGDARLGGFVNGVLQLKSNLPEGEKYYVVSNEIVVDADNPRKGLLQTTPINRWLSIVPPLIAVVLAIWLKNVLISLFTAIWMGAAILFQWNFWKAFVATIDTFLIGELVANDSGQHTHMQIALFTLFLGAMVGVMYQSGGTMALVNRMNPMTQTREHGQLMTWFLGLIIFFDDYANTLLVGSTMRPVTDRLKISREKLAFLVDSTAAPIAGLAFISTWVGMEVNLIGDAYRELGIAGDAYETFLYTIPFRFYPLHLLVFVLLIAYTGHDYGSMLKAEERALSQDDEPDEKTSQPETPVKNKPDEDSAESESEEKEVPENPPQRQYARNALIPLIVLIASIVTGLVMTGKAGIATENIALVAAGKTAKPINMANILGAANSNHVLLISSFLASAMAVTMATASRSLSLRESLEAWMKGAKTMFEAVAILTLAWGIAVLCDKDHLNTAGFIIEMTDGLLSAVWMPTLAFILAGLVAFATGSSWATMGLLMPLLISITFHLIVNQEQALTTGVNPHHPVLLGTIGAILAGAIFGDHCSPISDTTILSSAAAGCDHLDHVATQIPYAFTVAGVSLLFGYIPAGLGYSPVITLPLGVGVLLLIVLFLGRPPKKIVVPVEQPVTDSEEENEE